ncbi:MAG: hypothetical protein ACFB02_20420 [Mastigocoleus sp.]
MERIQNGKQINTELAIHFSTRDYVLRVSDAGMALHTNPDQVIAKFF